MCQKVFALWSIDYPAISCLAWVAYGIKDIALIFNQQYCVNLSTFLIIISSHSYSKNCCIQWELFGGKSNYNRFKASCRGSFSPSNCRVIKMKGPLKIVYKNFDYWMEWILKLGRILHLWYRVAKHPYIHFSKYCTGK